MTAVGSASSFLDPWHRPVAEQREACRQSVRFLLLCCWLLMLMTFSPPGGRGGSEVTFDGFAVAKAGARVAVFGALSIYLFRHRHALVRNRVFGRLAPWYFFGVLAVASVLWSPLKSITIFQASSFVLLLMLATAIGISVSLEEMSRILHGLTLAIVTACAVLLAMYFVAPAWQTLERTTSGLAHPTNASAAASLGLLLLVATRMLYGWTWSRRLLIPGLIICGTTLFIAQSRTAVAMTVLTIGPMVMWYLPSLWRSVAILAAGMAGLLFVGLDASLGLTDLIFEQVTDYAVRGQTTQQLAELSGRGEMWEAMWQSFLASPWIGHGYFVSSAEGELYVWYQWTNWTAHNFCLQILVTVGVLGLGTMLWAIGKFMLDTMLAAVRGKFEWQLALIVGAIVFWQIGWGINNESFVGPLQPESVVYLVMVGLVAGRIAHGSQIGDASSIASATVGSSHVRPLPVL